MEKLKERLARAGHKLTGPRWAVWQKLIAAKQPFSAQALYQQIKGVNRASVYRALHLLEELDLVNVEVIGQEKHYCLAAPAHHHIICRNCGYLEKVECTHDLGRFPHFSQVSHQLTLTGLCPKCR
ncbi:MAG: Fur family transcriptional regulator [Patescibacteria group bacterium]